MKIAGGHQTIQSKHAGSQNDCGAGPLREATSGSPCSEPGSRGCAKGRHPISASFSWARALPPSRNPGTRALLPSPAFQDQLRKDEKYWEFLVDAEKGASRVAQW